MICLNLVNCRWMIPRHLEAKLVSNPCFHDVLVVAVLPVADAIDTSSNCASTSDESKYCSAMSRAALRWMS